MFPISNFIELLFHRGGKIEIHDVLKILFQKVIYNHPDICGEKFAFLKPIFFLNHLFVKWNHPLRPAEPCHAQIPFRSSFTTYSLLLNGGNGGGIGGGTADSQLFHFLHQAGFGIPGWLQGCFFCGFNHLPASAYHSSFTGGSSPLASSSCSSSVDSI